jgi:hypothetical protein
MRRQDCRHGIDRRLLDSATGWRAERKGKKRGAAYAYNIKELRDREIDVARHAEHAVRRPMAAAWSW